MPDQTSILFKQVEIIDGTGKPSFVGDVAVRKDRIAAVGPQLDSQAEQIVDGRGLCLSPGFIDTHTHDDRALIDAPDMICKISQGVTTVVTGNCGISLAPYKTKRPIQPPQDLLAPTTDSFYADFAAYHRALEKQAPVPNFVSLVGHSTLRLACQADLTRAATAAETEKMAALLGQALADGAKGLSLGLEYAIAQPAGSREIQPLVDVLAKQGGVLTTHMRTEADDILRSLAEVIAYTKKAQVPLVISHLKCAGRKNFGRAGEVLRFIEDAARSQEIVFDAYPYTVGATILAYDICQRSDKTIVIQSTPHPEMDGLSLLEIAERWGCDAEGAVQKLLPAQALYHLMAEEDVRLILNHPLGMIGSDGIHSKKPHPRLWGSFPLFLGAYAREGKALTIEEAIRKITSLPAQTFRLQGRGEIREGFFADLVLFNKNTICDRATYDAPEQKATGIQAVYVNGRPALRGGPFLQHGLI